MFPSAEPAYRKAYRAANSERVREVARLWYHANKHQPEFKERLKRNKKRSEDKNKNSPRAIAGDRRRRNNWARKNKDKIRDAALRRNYGITQEQWDKLFESQGRSCAICLSEDPVSKYWHTDHCHTTGAVRGILCHRCNLMVGQAQDDENRLVAAAEYLKRSKCQLPQ